MIQLRGTLSLHSSIISVLDLKAFGILFGFTYQMARLISTLSFGIALAEVAKQGANPPPYDLISVALESETGDPVEARRSYEESRFEAQALARVAERKAKADRSLASLLAAEKGHASFLAAAPVIELSLASPVSVHSSVGSAIAAAEASRDAIVDSGLKKLMLAYNAAKIAGAKEVSAAIGGASKTSFAAFNPVEPTLKAHLIESHSADSNAPSQISSLESARNAALESTINQAIAEFSEITKVIVGEFSRHLSHRGRKSSFLTASGLNKELNVKLVANQNYATVGTLAEKAEQRRDVVENHLQQHILDLELKLVEFLLAAGQKALGQAM
jgi:hypothetical protein